MKNGIWAISVFFIVISSGFLWFGHNLNSDDFIPVFVAMTISIALCFCAWLAYELLVKRLDNQKKGNENAETVLLTTRISKLESDYSNLISKLETLDIKVTNLPTKKSENDELILLAEKLRKKVFTEKTKDDKLEKVTNDEVPPEIIKLIVEKYNLSKNGKIN